MDVLGIISVIGVSAEFAAGVSMLFFLLIMLPGIVLNEIDKLFDDVDEDSEGN